MGVRIHIDTLPEERTPVTTPARFALALSLAVVALAALNALLAYELKAHPRNIGYGIVEAKWEAAAALEEAPTWLFVGDSSCNQGIRASRFAEALGESAWNGCTIGSATVADDVWMVTEFVRRGLVPEHVVLANSWTTWKRESSALRAMLFLIEPGPRVWRDTEPRLELTPGDRWLARWGGALPLASQAISARTVVFDPTRENLPPRFSPEADGFMPVSFRDDARVRADIANHQTQMRRPFEVSAWTEGALHRLLELAEEHAFTVHFVVSPMPIELEETDEARRFLGELAETVDSVAARSPRASVAIARPLALPAEVFEKADHVTVDGADAYTDAVIEALR